MKVKSKKPRNQRNALRKVKNHQVCKVFTAPLDEALQEEFGVKRLSLRKDDSVRIVSGEFEGIEGNILKIDKKTRRIQIEEVTHEKKDGSTYYIPISICKIVITKFHTENSKIDPWRQKIMDRMAHLDVMDE